MKSTHKYGLAALGSFLLGSFLLGCLPAASISTNPISGNVVYFNGTSLRECAPAGGECSKPVTLDFKPVAIAQTSNSKIVLLAKDHIKICDNPTSCSVRMDLPFDDAADVAVGPADKPLVVSRTGKIAICDGGTCSLVP